MILTTSFYHVTVNGNDRSRLRFDGDFVNPPTLKTLIEAIESRIVSLSTPNDPDDEFDTSVEMNATEVANLRDCIELLSVAKADADGTPLTPIKVAGIVLGRINVETMSIYNNR